MNPATSSPLPLPLSSVLPVLTLADCDPKDEAFNWRENATGRTMMINVSRLAAHIDEMRRVAPETIEAASYEGPIDLEFAQWLLANNNPDAACLRQMVERFALGAENDRDKRPVIICEMRDGSALLVDGTHRYIARALTGRRTIRGVIVPPNVWAFFVVADAPAGLIEDHISIGNGCGFPSN